MTEKLVQISIRVVSEKLLREQFEDWKLQEDESDSTDEEIIERLKGVTIEEMVAYVLDVSLANLAIAWGQSKDSDGWTGLGLERM